MIGKPVIAYSTLPFGNASDDDRSLWRSEGIMMDPDPGASDLGAVFSVPAAVHVEAVAEGFPELDVVCSLIACARSAGPRNRVAVEVEKIVLDQGFGHIEAYSIAQALVLIVVNVVVLNTVIRSAPEVDRRQAPACQLAVVGPESRVFGADAAGDGKPVVILLSPALRKGTAVVVHSAIRIGTADPKPADADVRTGRADQGARFEHIAEDERAP